MTKHTDFARPVDRALHEAPGVPAAAASTEPRFSHPRAVPAGAPVAVAKPPQAVDPSPSGGRKWEDVRREDNDRVLARIEAKALDNPVDRALHQPVDTAVAPPSLALHARQTTVVPADAPLPGTVPAVIDDPWRPLQHFPGPTPVAPPRAPDGPEGRDALDAALTAAQFAAVAASRAKLDRARSYAGRLGTHAAEIRGRLSAASAHQVAAAIGKAEPDATDVGPLRGELVTVERQHRQALAALADVEAEHTRHEADLAALTGSDGAARAKLAEAHATRALAQTAADDVNALLARATVHLGTVSLKLSVARGEEARHDADATARLRAALAAGEIPPAAAEPLLRISPALEDDLRAATAAVEALTAEHAGKRDALAIAHRAVLAAVDGVLVVEAEAVARECQAADDRALALRTRLHCYANRRAGDYVAPKPKPSIKHPNGLFEPHPDTALAAFVLPPAIRTTNVIGAALAAAPMPPHQGVFSNNWTAENAAWERYAAALAADPQAEPAFNSRPVSAPSAPLPASSAA